MLPVGAVGRSATAATDSQFNAYGASVDTAMSAIVRDIVPPPAPPVPIPGPAEPVTLRIPATVEQSVVPASDGLPDQIAQSSAASFWSGGTGDLNDALLRLDRIRPALERILKQEGVPARFAAVVLVESGARATALSSKSARGLWQLIPETARRYGLVVNKRRDDRINLALATRAAARYLRDLYEMFGTWRLALAAYNAGEGAIKSALNRADSANFQELSDRKLIPAETRRYVPKVMAAINLLMSAGGTETAVLGSQL